MSATKEAAEQVRAPAVDEHEARQVAEAARETEWTQPSFVLELFLGQLHLDLIHPMPAHDSDEQRRAADFHRKLFEFAKTVDGEEIERTGRIPEHVIDGMRKLGAFGIKI